MLSKVWDDITYPFINFNGCTVEVKEWIINFTPHYNGCDYVSILGINSKKMSKRASGEQKISTPPLSIIYSPCIKNHNTASLHTSQTVDTQNTNTCNIGNSTTATSRVSSDCGKKSAKDSKVVTHFCHLTFISDEDLLIIIWIKSSDICTCDPSSKQIHN